MQEEEDDDEEEDELPTIAARMKSMPAAQGSMKASSMKKNGSMARSGLLLYSVADGDRRTTSIDEVRGLLCALHSGMCRLAGCAA